MTLMKSILLASAAGIVSVAAAQAADLPTRKAAPAEYVRICNVGGMAGFIIPGSDTCLKISGYIVAEFTFGNLNQSYGGAPVVGDLTPAQYPTANPSRLRPDIGFDTRANFSLDMRQDTAYGVLRGYFDFNFDTGNGFDALAGPPTNAVGYIDHAYLQWAGITAGKANSFFSFYGGGEAWANLFSPDRQGYNQPILFAYTATFGGGFSATISAESAGNVAIDGGGGTNTNYFSPIGFGGTDYMYNGTRAPDLVAALRVDQGWGSAQLSAVAHNVYTTSLVNVSTQNIWGWGINGGVKFNIPQFGPGDNWSLQATYTQNAIWYSGLADGMWGEGGATNGNGIAMPLADTFSYTDAAGNPVWATPTAWSISSTFEHHFSPTFSFDPEVAYGQVHWNQGGAGGFLAQNSESWIIGGVAHWDPVPHLDFELELLYQNTHQSTPGLYTAAASGGFAFPNNTDGFAGRFQITRDW
jgi:hypothetical protein